MSLDGFYQRLQLDESLVRNVGFNPYYRCLQSGLDDPIVIDNQEFINLAANNYLGLAHDARLKDAIAGGVQKYGASLCGTPIATGCVDLFRHLEQRLAAFVGLEDGILLPSGYQANNGLFSAVAGKEDVIVIDHFAHSSLIQGARSVGCPIRPFLHNDPDHLEGILKRLQKGSGSSPSTGGCRQIFVVTESVFSTEGSIAPFSRIVDLCREYDAVPVIDDSHGIGVLGRNGAGVLDHFSLHPWDGLYTASLGKAFANAGGLIAGKKTVIDHLRYYCPHLIYSTALPPGVVAGIHKVLDILASDFDALSTRMWEYKTRIQESLKSAGLQIIRGEAPINSIASGNPEQTWSLAKRFYQDQILVTPFIYPSVPLHEGRVRLIAGANLREETVTRVQELIPRIADEFRRGTAA